MSVENVSEFKSFHSRLAENQPQIGFEKDIPVEKKVLPTDKQDAGDKSANQRSNETSKAGLDSEPDNQAIQERLKTVNEQFPLKSTSLVFEFDDANDPPIIKVVDRESGDVIREIPPKELREIAKALSDIADNLNSESRKLHDKHSSGILINEQL